MENENKKDCLLWPHACNGGIEQPKALIQPEPRQPKPELRIKDPQKPWSIFGDVYWI